MPLRQDDKVGGDGGVCMQVKLAFIDPCEDRWCVVEFIFVVFVIITLEIN